MVTAVGDDEQGRFVINGLKQEGVGTSHIKVVKKGRTAISQVIVNSETAERLIVHMPGANVEEALVDFNFDSESAWIHLDNRGYEALEKSGKRELALKNHEVSLDGGIHIQHLDLTNVDLYVPTISELRNLFGQTSSNLELLISAKSAGPNVVIATDGPNGSYSLESTAADEKTALVHCGAFAGEILSTLGAGDVFHGALLSQIIQGSDLRVAMTKANLCAFISCQALDGRSGIPTAKELNSHFSLQKGSEGAGYE
jgi:sugar/nucleoside kinase (ribokinase family)